MFQGLHQGLEGLSAQDVGSVTCVLADIDDTITTEGRLTARAYGALERLQEMVDQAAFVPRIRRATKPTRGSQLRRLESKMTRGRIKSLRGKVSE